MIDIAHIKQQIDCRDLVEHDLGRPKLRSNRYNVYKCPLHHEQKGFSLVVYEDHWHCFGKCNRGGDAIAWLQEYHNLTFREACKQLSDGRQIHVSRNREQNLLKHETMHLVQTQSQPPNTDWQLAARKVVNQAMDTLWSKHGKRAWRYLEEQRSLSEDTIIHAELGYIPGSYREWKNIAGLKVPCGITIPWLADHVLWGIKVRRAAGQQRYQQVSGGNIKGCLYLADDIEAGMPILLTEGEFDALIAQQVGAGLISVAAIGSAANKHINPRWYIKFITAPSLFVCMDADRAGEKAASHIAGLSQAATCVQVPQGKDINEFYLLAGHNTVRNWIAQTDAGHT